MYYTNDDWGRLFNKCGIFFFTMMLIYFILELIFKVKVIAKINYTLFLYLNNKLKDFYIGNGI